MDTNLKCILSNSTTYIVKLTIVLGRVPAMMVSERAILDSLVYVSCSLDYFIILYSGSDFIFNVFGLIVKLNQVDTMAPNILRNWSR
ncbi:hypothetical protein BDV40DRAFT_251811 [Aspergillus tamarii]|uniref:Uncharacterized protein n=1 Tax=Aspergillus tamarii TaxID=41984 RepID=A0A5N6VBA7_ASPTM|nr:hypothetical protein BDV40DRAFT_251811 [Aspergillus tamarii]